MSPKLWNTKFDNNLFLTDLWMVLNQFMYLSYAKVIHTNQPFALYHLYIGWFFFFGPATQSIHVNTVITINKVHSMVNFNWKDCFDSKKINQSALLKAYSRFFTYRLPFHNNLTISHSNSV